ncbi:MAG: uracil-DNA glycosylase [Alphaproteobacteria bacterium]
MDQRASLQDFIAWQEEVGVGDIKLLEPLLLEQMAQNPSSVISATKPAAEPIRQVSLPPKTSREASGDVDLRSCGSLEALRQALESFEGCALKQTATQTVFSDGSPQRAKVMLVGEAPGADEDRLGKPFVGLSGQLLDKMFRAIGLSRQDNLYISNIVPWRPPGNRQPTSGEIAVCLPFIERHIGLVNPPFLVALGGTACKAFLQKTEGITKLRGRWFPYQNPYLDKPIPLLVTYHPAYLLRSPGQKKEVWKDLLTLQDALRNQAVS